MFSNGFLVGFSLWGFWNKLSLDLSPSSEISLDLGSSPGLDLPWPAGGPVIGIVEVEGKGGGGAFGTATGVVFTPVVAGITAGVVVTGCVVDACGADGSVCE